MRIRNASLVGRRRSEQREAIRQAVEGAPGPLTAREVLVAAQRAVPGLGIATVYRNLRLLAEQGVLQLIDLPGEPSRYEAAGRHHHHHFRCDSCGQVIDVGGCLPSLDAALPDDFTVRRHDVVFYGLCPSCA